MTITRRNLFGLMAGAAVAPMLPAEPIFGWKEVSSVIYFDQDAFHQAMFTLMTENVSTAQEVISRLNRV